MSLPPPPRPRTDRRISGPDRTARPPGRPGGFTLIELLIVIGIVALLIAVLGGVYSRVRGQARTAMCLSNLRQIGAAALVYAAKYDNFTVPGYRDPNIKPGGNAEGADIENYATVLVNEGLVPAPDVAGIGGGIKSERSVFRCADGTDDLVWDQFTTAEGSNPTPEGRRDAKAGRPIRVHSRKTGIVVDTWYGVNLQTNNTETYRTPCRRLPSNDATPWALPKYGQIPDPARMVFLYDGIFFNLSYDADRIHARHGGGTQTNLLFFDGHAETFQTKNLPGGMGPNPSGTDRFSNAALGPNPLLMWRLDGK